MVFGKQYILFKYLSNSNCVLKLNYQFGKQISETDTRSLHFFEAIWTADSWVYKELGIQTRGKECRTLQSSVCLLA